MIGIHNREFDFSNTSSEALSLTVRGRIERLEEKLEELRDDRGEIQACLRSQSSLWEQLFCCGTSKVIPLTEDAREVLRKHREYTSQQTIGSLKKVVRKLSDRISEDEALLQGAQKTQETIAKRKEMKLRYEDQRLEREELKQAKAEERQAQFEARKKAQQERAEKYKKKTS